MKFCYMDMFAPEDRIELHLQHLAYVVVIFPMFIHVIFFLSAICRERSCYPEIISTKNVCCHNSRCCWSGTTRNNR